MFTRAQSLALVAQIGEWIKSELRRANCRETVLGLSGGADSALVAAILKRANIPVILVALPCVDGSPISHQSVVDAWRVANWLRLSLEVKNIYPAFRAFVDELPPAKNPLAEANLKSRLRMCALYYFANNAEGGALVIGTTNATEMYIGYFTKHGDGAEDLEPIAVFRKNEVYDMLRALDAPEWIIAKAPSADLLPGQTDEGEIGLTYAEMDRAVEQISCGYSRVADPRVMENISARHRASEHKRRLPPEFKRPPGF